MLTTFNGGAFKIDEDCPDLKGAFRFIAQCNETFGACGECENCKGTDVHPKYRQHGAYEYYEMECQACKWTFKFGQKKDDKQLFPKGWEPPYSSGQEDAPKRNSIPTQTSAPF